MGQYVSPFGSTPSAGSGGGAPSPAKLTNYISPFSGSKFTQDYWQQQQEQDQQVQARNKQISDLQNIDNLPYADQIKTINSAASAGLIKKEDQMQMINAAVDRSAPKTPDLNPIEQFVASTIGTGQRVVNTVAAAGQGIKTLGQAALDKMTGNKGYQSNLDANTAQLKSSLDAPAAIDGGKGSFLSYEQAQNKNNDIVGNFIQPIASTAGEVAPWVIPYGGVSKFAAPTAEKLATNLAESTVGKTLPPILQNAAGKVVKAGVEGAVQAPVFAGSNALTQYGDTGKVDVGQALGQGIVGGATAGIVHGIGSIFAKGPEAHLALQPAKGATDTLMPEVNPERFSSTFLNPQKVAVQGGDNAATPIGVTSPLKVGVKDVSNTSKVEVRTTPQMTDQQYTKQFNALSNSYDKAQKTLEGMPAIKQEAASRAIDEQHAQALSALDDAYNNPKLPEGTSNVKTIAKSTTKAPDNVGGTPSGYVNTTGQMSDLENTLFTAAKNKAEKRLGRDLTQQETSNLFDNTKKVVAEKMTPPTPPTPPETPPVPAGEPTPAVEPTSPIPPEAQQSATPIPEPPVTPSLPSEPAPKPQTEGDTVSGNSNRIQQVALEKKLTNTMGDLPKYKSLDMKEQARRAIDLVTNDRQKAIDIIDGKANPPDGLHPQAVHQALESVATKEGDGALLTKLAKSHINTDLSESAQNLRIAAEREPNSPVEAIRQIQETRLKAAEKRSGTTVAKETEKAVAAVKSSTRIVSKQDLAGFIKELTC